MISCGQQGHINENTAGCLLSDTEHQQFEVKHSGGEKKAIAVSGIKKQLLFWSWAQHASFFLSFFPSLFHSLFHSLSLSLWLTLSKARTTAAKYAFFVSVVFVGTRCINVDFVGFFILAQLPTGFWKRSEMEVNQLDGGCMMGLFSHWPFNTLHWGKKNKNKT